MFRYFIIIITLFLLQACASTSEQKASQETNYSAEELGKFVGVLKGVKYTNPSVPVKLKLPKDWFLTLSDKKVFAIDGSDEAVKLEPLVRNSYRLLYLLKYNEVPAGKFNTSLIFMTSDKSEYIKSTSADKHNERIRTGLGKSGRNYTFEQESYDKELAGKNFNVLPTSVKLNTGVEVFQEYHSVILDERLMTFILTYTNEEDRQDLEKIMKTVTFK